MKRLIDYFDAQRPRRPLHQPCPPDVRNLRPREEAPEMAASERSGWIRTHVPVTMQSVGTLWQDYFDGWE
jgi:hypothetical protein